MGSLWYESVCLLAGNDPTTPKYFTACGFGAWVAAISVGYSFVLLAFILVEDDCIGQPVKDFFARKATAQWEFVFGSLWAFIWFAFFCYGIDAWRHAPKCKIYTKYKTPSLRYCPETYGVLWVDNHVPGNAGAVIAFSFFSFIAWTALSFLAFKRHRAGDTSYDYQADKLDDDAGAGAIENGKGAANGGAGSNAPDSYQNDSYQTPGYGEDKQVAEL